MKNNLFLILICTIFIFYNSPMSRSISRSMVETEQERRNRRGTVVVQRQQQNNHPLVLRDKLLLFNADAKEFLTYAQARQFAEEIKAEVLEVSAKDLVDADETEEKKHQITRLYFKAKSINENTGNPVVILVKGIEDLMSKEANDRNGDLDRVHSALLKLFDKISEHKNSYSIISLFTTEIDPTQRTWVTATRVKKEYWQIPDPQRKETILRIQLRRQQEIQRLEQARIEREERERQRIAEAQRRKEEEERRRNELAEKIRRQEEEKRQKEEALRMQREKEDRECPLYKEVISTLNRELGDITSELKNERKENIRLQSDLNDQSSKSTYYANRAQKTEQEYRVLSKTVQRLTIALSASVVFLLIRPVSLLIEKIKARKGGKATSLSSEIAPILKSVPH